MDKQKSIFIFTQALMLLEFLDNEKENCYYNEIKKNFRKFCYKKQKEQTNTVFKKLYRGYSSVQWWTV